MTLGAYAYLLSIPTYVYLESFHEFQNYFCIIDSEIDTITWSCFTELLKNEELLFGTIEEYN